MIKISKIIGWLFIVLGIANIILSSINTGGIFLDFASLLFGYLLIKQNNMARKIVSVMSGIAAVVGIIVLFMFTVNGIPKNASISMFKTDIHLTSLLDAYLLIGSQIIVAALLFIILRSQKVINEFESSTQSV